jgi:hypothetical protein
MTPFNIQLSIRECCLISNGIWRLSVSERCLISELSFSNGKMLASNSDYSATHEHSYHDIQTGRTAGKGIPLEKRNCNENLLFSPHLLPFRTVLQTHTHTHTHTRFFCLILMHSKHMKNLTPGEAHTHTHTHTQILDGKLIVSADCGNHQIHLTRVDTGHLSISLSLFLSRECSS